MGRVYSALKPTLLLLIPVILDYARLQQHAIRLVFRLDKYTRFVLYRCERVLAILVKRPRDICGTPTPYTYIDDLAGTETGASIKPVIVAQLVDLDSLLVVGKRRLHCHDGRDGNRKFSSAGAGQGPAADGKRDGSARAHQRRGRCGWWLWYRRRGVGRGDVYFRGLETALAPGRPKAEDGTRLAASRLMATETLGAGGGSQAPAVVKRRGGDNNEMRFRRMTCIQDSSRQVRDARLRGCR